MSPAGDGPVVGSRPVPVRSSAFAVALAESNELPTGFPPVLDSPLAWTGGQFQKESEYVLQLTKGHLQEIEAALVAFKELGLDGDLVSRDNFPLPTLKPELTNLGRAIHSGRGFALVRGLNPQKMSVEDLTTVYMGIQSYMADQQGRQDKKGNMLVHIIADNSTEIKASHHRHSTSPIVKSWTDPLFLHGKQTTNDGLQTFHNEEAGDVVSWLTRSTAASGGKCIIASSYTVYNALAATRPDLLRVLARSDWPFALPQFHCRPVLFHHKGRVMTNFGRTALMGSASHVRPAHLPKLNGAQVEALDAIETIAKATQLEITTQAGDMHFINNLAILHRREGFVNGTSALEKRHLVRMRLRDEALGWAIPEALLDEWNKAFDPRLTRVWHLEPMPDGYFPLRSQSN
ncbi:uncharacterized protein UV8b_02157 [Ustilaginoidea virens]|uniref:TauD/TfdA-like domain-containing protein n=1 Tax=Ustilaginoidea virens TaxID=1159556 RepID=A0A8E5MFV5_USTVR|nr:uncharacterized protein UV8b_02157 [Ustilaginoidea virens]QUC17916.1 hypothetical protein UV8b_02157 [Ustilaginoidea virens]